MYSPSYNHNEDRADLVAFMRANSFAVLVTGTGGALHASHLPVRIDEEGEKIVLDMHMAKNNAQWKEFFDDEAMVVFAGPHAYVSPRWYTEMRVPTWNYISVHVYGTVKIMEGDILKAALSRLIDTYEHHMPQPVHKDEIPEKSLRDDLRGIVGFEILVTEYQAAAKLSQNRDQQSYHQVITHLDQGDETARAVAAEMQKNTVHLFPPNDK